MLIKVVHASCFDIRFYSMHVALVGLAKFAYDSEFVMWDCSGWALVEKRSKRVENGPAVQVKSNEKEHPHRIRKWLEEGSGRDF